MGYKVVGAAKRFLNKWQQLRHSGYSMFVSDNTELSYYLTSRLS